MIIWFNGQGTLARLSNSRLLLNDGSVTQELTLPFVQTGPLLGDKTVELGIQFTIAI